MNNATQKIKCPICEKAETWTAENNYKPFCSSRCKLIDLGEWANESRKINGVEGTVQTEEDFEG